MNPSTSYFDASHPKNLRNDESGDFTQPNFLLSLTLFSHSCSFHLIMSRNYQFVEESEEGEDWVLSNFNFSPLGGYEDGDYILLMPADKPDGFCTSDPDRFQQAMKAVPNLNALQEIRFTGRCKVCFRITKLTKF